VEQARSRFVIVGIIFALFSLDAEVAVKRTGSVVGGRWSVVGDRWSVGGRWPVDGDRWTVNSTCGASG
jgi:hypothetical protein